MAAPSIGDDIVVAHLANGHDVERAYGALGVEVDESGRVTAIVVEETDGSATRITRGAVISVEADR